MGKCYARMRAVKEYVSMNAQALCKCEVEIVRSQTISIVTRERQNISHQGINIVG